MVYIYNSNIKEYLKKVDIYFKKEKIEFCDYENLIINTIFEITNNNSKKNLFVSIDNDISQIIAIVFIALYNYISNLLDNNNNILNQLSINDKVVKDKVIYIFWGENKINDKRYILLDDTKGCRINVPIENMYQITKYNGNASRINNSRNINVITKKYMANLLEIPEEKFIGYINNCSIVVVENKEKLFKMIENIEILHNEKKYNISELFPFAYCSSSDRFEFMKGNKIKQNPLIKFVSNSSVALDIIQDNTNINNVLFLGTKTYNEVIDTDVRQMELYDYIDKIIFFDSIDSNFDFSIFDQEVSIYAFTQNVILNNINLYKNNYKSKLQSDNLKRVDNFINKQINIYEINDEDEISSNIKEIYIETNKLRKYQYDDNIKYFRILTFSLCKKIRQSILPLKESERNYIKIDNYFKSIKDCTRKINSTRIEYSIMNKIIKILNSITTKLSIVNNKNDIIKSKYSNIKKISMIIKNKEEKGDLIYYYRKYPSIKLDIYNFKEYIDSKINIDYLIMPFCCNDNKDSNIISINSYKKLDIFVYSFEKKVIESNIKRANNGIYFLSENNMLLCELEENEEFYCINKKYGINKEINEDEVDIEYEEDIKIEDKLGIFASKLSNSNINNNKNIQISKIVLFDNEYCAFLTEHYQASVLSLSGKDIIRKTPDKLKVGDKMIFIVDKTDEDGDIVKKVIKNLLSYSEFNDKYGEYFRLNDLWKKKLKKYMYLNNLTEEDIANKFLLQGKKINKVTIYNWINGDIVGPRNDNDIKIVASIINDREINSNIEEIIKACSIERKLQIRIRKIVAQIILNSLITSEIKDSSLHNMIKNVIGDFRQYIYIKQIIQMVDYSENVNVVYVNKLFKDGGIYIE